MSFDEDSPETKDMMLLLTLLDNEDLVVVDEDLVGGTDGEGDTATIMENSTEVSTNKNELADARPRHEAWRYFCDLLRTP